MKSINNITLLTMLEQNDQKIMQKTEDAKLRELINVLREKNILADPDLKRILPLEPLPQLFPQ